MTMSRYRHFTMDERESLLIYLNQGKKNCEIAKLLNRSPSTISRELRRNAETKSKYSALKVQKDYEHRRKYSVRKYKLADQAFAWGCCIEEHFYKIVIITLNFSKTFGLVFCYIYKMYIDKMR